VGWFGPSSVCLRCLCVLDGDGDAWGSINRSMEAGVEALSSTTTGGGAERFLTLALADPISPLRIGDGMTVATSV
jgi:hypothetical protein